MLIINHFKLKEKLSSIIKIIILWYDNDKTGGPETKDAWYGLVFSLKM